MLVNDDCEVMHGSESSMLITVLMHIFRPGRGMDSANGWARFSTTIFLSGSFGSQLTEDKEQKTNGAQKHSSVAAQLLIRVSEFRSKIKGQGVHTCIGLDRVSDIGKNYTGLGTFVRRGLYNVRGHITSSSWTWE
eukprot:812819_1